ncbi:MAG TPA: ATP citrate lyase citrate-binding domain-containing protein [Candidatus Bilamarchaeaceae archaeon]|nr:ATP citrate lyase citrate-binding domain-containing protein [Candidatus Bilamarchaeaceae archaeon]
MIPIARRKIREIDGRNMFGGYFNIPLDGVLVSQETDIENLPAKYYWLKSKKLVVKPDMLIGKKGKNNLILLNADFSQAKKFIKENMNKQITIGKVTGNLTHFIIQPFVPHEEEYFVSIMSGRDSDTIYFSDKGGVDVEENWDKIKSISVPILGEFPEVELKSTLTSFPKNHQKQLFDFIKRLHMFFVDYDFSYLELNPFSFVKNLPLPLGFVGELDDCAEYKNCKKWGDLKFPQSFGKTLTKEENFIKDLDSKTGASLKLTILNPNGKVWPMVAGGGASVIYADTIVDLGFSNELAIYGEYSGDPNEEETYQYATTILDLMTREKRKDGKILIIGGGIANFTDVAKTFQGIVRALRDYKEKLQKNNVKIYVRRGGPNYEIGLNLMKKLGNELGVPMEVYGPETHMTKIVSLALMESGIQSKGNGKSVLSLNRQR